MMKIKITYVYCRLRLRQAVPAGRLRFFRANCVESRDFSLCLLVQPWVPAVNICEIIGVGDVQVISFADPNWWQDKKTPERHGIRIPVLDADGNQKLDSRNRKQWKREVTDATGWDNQKNCELWRSEQAKECNLHLKKEQQIDHRSYERQGKIEIPTIHEGADARKIEEKYHSGQFASASWKVEENRIIKKQNAILKKLQEVFGQVGILLKQWKERLNDIRRKQRSYSSDGEYDKTDRGSTETYGRDVPGDGAAGRTTQFVSRAESKIAGIKQRVAKAVSNLAKYRETVGIIGEEGRRNSDIERGKLYKIWVVYYIKIQLCIISKSIGLFKRKLI